MTEVQGGENPAENPPCGCACHASSGTHRSCTVDAGYGAGCGPHGTTPTATERAAVLDAAVRDHWRAVDALTKPRRVTLTRDDGLTSYAERVTLPSMLDQLIEAMQNGGESGGSGGVPASRPPADATVLSLLVEIAQHVGDGCRQRKIKRKFDTAADLRALASSINTEGDLARIEACTKLVRSWCGQIRATIQPDVDRTWRMHGAACTVCGSTTVPAHTDGQETRVPALIVHSDDGVIDRVVCDFCGSALTGIDLVALVRDTRTAVDRERTA